MSRLVVVVIGDVLFDIVMCEGFDLCCIVNVMLVGNMVMLVLLFGYNFSLLLQLEYWMQVVDCVFFDIRGWVVMWEINLVVVVDVFLLLVGFVGLDLLVGLVVMCFIEGFLLVLFIDFGINFEIVLWYDGVLWVIVLVGGLVFESNVISCGVLVEVGVVFWVIVDVSSYVMVCQIIGDDWVKGFCGFGLVDLIVCLCNVGQLSSVG